MAPEQHSRVEYSQFMEKLMQLPIDQREALILIGASGFSQETAAEICGCAVGTVKSRVHRARKRLAAMMNLDETDTFGPDRASLAIVA
jgi:RNA polymerase sigma-70 factor (ECF subfamily)